MEEIMLGEKMEKIDEEMAPTQEPEKIKGIESFYEFTQ